MPNNGRCPFADLLCEGVKCQLWDTENKQCVIALIAFNLATLNKTIEAVIDKMVFKH